MSGRELEPLLVLADYFESIETKEALKRRNWRSLTPEERDTYSNMTVRILCAWSDLTKLSPTVLRAQHARAEAEAARVTELEAERARLFGMIQRWVYAEDALNAADDAGNANDDDRLLEDEYETLVAELYEAEEAFFGLVPLAQAPAPATEQPGGEVTK